MPIDILMPALSPTMEEGTLAKWLVKEGDSVQPGDVIAEIETDKATMEVEAVDEGVLEKILVPAGTEGVKVNAKIALLSGADAPAPAAAKPEPAPPQPEASAKPEPAKPPAAAPPAPKEQGEGGARVLASPLAKRLAQQAGIALSGLKGSGPNGRVVKQDVESALAAKPKGAPGPSSGVLVPFRAPGADVARPQPAGYPEGSYDIVPMDGMRKAIARRMTASFRDVPHFPLTIDVEIDQLLKARAQLNARLEGEGVKLSVNDLLIRVAALALKKVPDANVSFAGDAIWRHRHAHVAVAVAIPGGLVTPVVFNAEAKGLAEISREMKALAEKARARKLMPHEYEGGTFTISNLGMMGIKSFSSILNEPQAMILSVGAGEKRPIVRDNAVAVATMMTLTLTCDHRAVDGAIGAEFLAALRLMLEDPMMMMA